MMVHEQNHRALTLASVLCGFLVPFGYFGSQLLAQALSPEYDWRAQVASELGRVGSPAAGLFNWGMAITAISTLLAIPGFYMGLKRLNASAGAWLVAGCLLASGCASLWAALHPLPSPSHNPGLLFLTGIVLFPGALAGAFLAAHLAPNARIYLMVSFVGAVLLLLLSELGLAPIAPPGVMQRLGAALVYPPVAIGSYIVLAALRAR